MRRRAHTAHRLSYTESAQEGVGGAAGDRGLTALKQDLLRYPTRSWHKEPPIWALAVYRLSQEVDHNWRIGRRVLGPLTVLLELIARAATGIEIGRTAEIAPGCRIYHGRGIVIHSDARIGRNVVIRQGVTIGNRAITGPSPTIGDDVELGAYAQVLGGIAIGSMARIGAMSVVLTDVPEGATAVGVPASVRD